jgi:hypothetical protein
MVGVGASLTRTIKQRSSEYQYIKKYPNVLNGEASITALRWHLIVGGAQAIDAKNYISQPTIGIGLGLEGDGKLKVAIKTKSNFVDKLKIMKSIESYVQ